MSFRGAEEAFAVSTKIVFYERTELEEWVLNRRDNILLVAEAGSRIEGFLYCKVMSHHWAYLDNFYVSRVGRLLGAGRLLLAGVMDEVRGRGITYLSTLIDPQRAALGRLLVSCGFERSRDFVWYGAHVDTGARYERNRRSDVETDMGIGGSAPSPNAERVPSL